MSVETPSPDFGNLPIVAWIRVLEFLPLKDRYNASMVCWNIHNAFNDPILWQTVTLEVKGHSGKYRHFDSAKVPEKNFHLVRKFGNIFLDVTFSVLAPLGVSFGDWNTVLEESTTNCNLKCVTFDVGGLINVSNLRKMKTLPANLKPMTEIVRNSSYLKTLQINSWPVFPRSLDNKDENIFLAAIENNKIKDLRKLSLFKCESIKWSERMPSLLSTDLTQMMVDHFKNLTHLALRSPMISGDLIDCLSCRGRRPLQEFQITINYVPELDLFKIPQVNDSSWNSFATFNTNVAVDVLILSRVPHDELQRFLRPACPLFKVRFGEYGRTDKEFIAYMADAFSSTLDTFEYHYNEHGDFERELVTLVENSYNLCRLIYRGKISSENVLHLAELRGTKWEAFHISRKNIYTKSANKATESVYDSDQVISKNSDGEYVLVDMLKFFEQVYIADDQHEEQNLVENVSQKMGRHWCPDESQ